MQLNIFKKKQTKIDNVIIPETPMTIEETIQLLFLVLPYIKFIKDAKEKYRDEIKSDVFSFMIKTLLTDMDQEDLFKALSLLFHLDVEILKLLPFNKIVFLVPRFVKINKLYELFLVMKSFGAYN